MRKDYRPKPPEAFTRAIIFAALFLGTVLGSLAAGSTPADSFSPLSQNIYTSFLSLGGPYDSAPGFGESVFRHLRTVLLIWVLGFLYAGGLFQTVLIALRGFFVGYGVSILVMQFGAAGLALAFAAVLVSNIFLFLICLWIILNTGPLPHKPYNKFLIPAASLAGTVLIGLYEAYVSPPLCLLIFNALN